MSTPNQIQGGRWDTFLRSKFNLKGGPIAPEIAPELITTVDLPFQREDFFLLRERLMTCRIAPSAVAGQFARGWIRNPLNSGHLIVIEKVFIQNVGATAFLSGAGGVILTDTNVNQRVMDGRWARPTANAPGVAECQQGNNAVRQAFDHLRIAADFEGVIDYNLVLSPNGPDMLLFEANTVNQAIQCNFFWREVVLEPSANA